jgi:hypothetical protein
LTENSNIKTTTVFINGLRCHAPEAGVKLFIPGDVKQKEEARTIAPSLNEPIEFDGYTVSQINSQEAAKRLMNQKLRGVSSDFLKSSNGVAILTETVQQFKDADKTNNYAATTVDMIEQANMQLVEDKLEFMTKVQPSIHSYLTGKYLQYLPVDVLMSSLNACDGETSDKFDKILNGEVEVGKMLKDYTYFFAPLHVTKLKLEDSTFSFYDATMEMGYRIKELARGDFDGDGNEDALIEIGWHTQGTMGGSFTSVVTRTGPDQKVKWLMTDGDKCEKPETTSASNQNYAQTVQFAYDKAWMPPEEPSAASNTKASVTIASDGRVIASNIISPSGNASVDRSVQNTLDKITFVAPFPDSVKFSKRTFIVNFGLKASR